METPASQAQTRSLVLERQGLQRWLVQPLSMPDSAGRRAARQRHSAARLPGLGAAEPGLDRTHERRSCGSDLGRGGRAPSKPSVRFTWTQLRDGSNTHADRPKAQGSWDARQVGEPGRVADSRPEPGMKSWFSRSHKRRTSALAPQCAQAPSRPPTSVNTRREQEYLDTFCSASCWGGVAMPWIPA
jgi:hypothetical protein